MTDPQAQRWVSPQPGIELPVFDLGGEGELLLLVHATGFHGRAYEPLVDGLRQHFHVVSADLRGHGEARQPSNLEYRWERFGEDVQALAGALAPDRPLLGWGHSMGAAALIMAQIARPAAFRRLFCYEPVIYPDDDLANRERLEQWAARTRHRKAWFPSHSEAIENFASKPPYDRFDSRSLEAFVREGFRKATDGSISLKCLPETEAQIYLTGPYHRTWDDLHRVDCPTQVASGALAQPGPSEWAHEIAQRIPAGEQLIFEGLGHLGPLENPDAVSRAAVEFLSEA